MHHKNRKISPVKYIVAWYQLLFTCVCSKALAAQRRRLHIISISRFKFFICAAVAWKPPPRKMYWNTFFASGSVAPECIGILTGTLTFNTLNYDNPMLPASHPLKVQSSWPGSDRVSNIYVSKWEGHGVTSTRQNWQCFTTCILYLVFLLTPGVNPRW